MMEFVIRVSIITVSTLSAAILVAYVVWVLVREPVLVEVVEDEGVVSDEG
jgi:hypothetical protein